jgi:hypothetical protein
VSDEQRYVWVVHYDSYGDKWISGIFDSEDKAVAWVEENDAPVEDRTIWNRDYTIEREILQ